jgi:DNA invertase Pin-like site-specific DNA recombinase
MPGLLIGYARVSTEEQDLTAQRDGLQRLGVEPSRIYVDHGLTGTNRDRPGLREALAGCRAGDTLVVTKLDRLARSLPDARAIAEDLTRRTVRFSLGGSVYDPADPVGRLLFNVLAMVAESEADLIRSRTREGMRVAKAKGHLRGKQLKLNPRQEAHLIELLCTGEYTTAELGDLFGVARSTVCRALARSTQAALAARSSTSASARPAPSPPRTGAVGARNNTAGTHAPYGTKRTEVRRATKGDSRPILPCRKWFGLRDEEDRQQLSDGRLRLECSTRDDTAPTYRRVVLQIFHDEVTRGGGNAPGDSARHR